MKTAFFVFAIISLLPAFSYALNIQEGSGKFTVEGGNDPSKTIDYYYHKPKSFNQNSKVLFVVPGSGRNAWSYRDSWVDASEQYDVLILSPSYSKKLYPRFWSYNLAGMINNVTIDKEKSMLKSFTPVNSPSQWIFKDFERVFTLVSSHLKLNTQTYDMFGHSAGGQVLHRLVIFGGESRANRIVAANSGWYTATDMEEAFPYGTGQSPISHDTLHKVFKSKLVIFLGELDNENETRGHLLRNGIVDKQGKHRLSRGKYFFDVAQKSSRALASSEFNWAIEVVPNVGHDYKRMGSAAAKYLYKSQISTQSSSSIQY